MIATIHHENQGKTKARLYSRQEDGTVASMILQGTYRIMTCVGVQRWTLDIEQKEMVMQT